MDLYRRPFPLRVRGARLVLLVLVLLCSAAAPPATAVPTVWVAPSLERISPDAPPGTGTQVHLYAARGEYESFQVIVRAAPAALTNVNVSAPELDGSLETIPATSFTLYREHYVHISDSSPDWGGRNRPLPPGWYPDALIPFVDPVTGQDLAGARFDAVPFDLPPNQNQPIWVDLLVPRSTPAGDYQGQFTVTSDQGDATVDLLLTVWAFALPHQPFLKSCFGTEESYRVKGDELLRHRLMPRKLNPADERAFIDGKGLNCLNAGFWSGADGQTCSMSPAPSPDTFLAAAALHQPDLFLYAYTADEIGHCTDLYASMREWSRNMHQSRLENLVTMAPVPELYDDGTGTGRSAVDIWVVLPKMYDESLSRIIYVQGKGDEVWSYNCLVQDSYSPKWQVDFSSLDFRLQPGFINQSLDLAGLLYWRADVWGADPWTDVSISIEGGLYAGEGLLLYPGDAVGLPGKVVPSLRLKYLRDGVDDYDYLQLLRAQGQWGWALPVARAVGADWTNWTRDPAVLDAARLLLGERLHALALGTHLLAVSASAASSVVASGSPVALAATAADSHGHPVTAWSWSDGGAGGSFTPSADVPDPTYTTPADAGGADLLVTLTVTATCSQGSGSDSVVITVVPRGSASFWDVPPDYWALPYIRACAAAGIVGGYDTGAFLPKQQVTRDQMAVFVSRALAGGDSQVPSGPAQATFPDVPVGHWAYRYVEYVALHSIVTGFGGGNYRPTQVVDRGQMSVFIARAIVTPPGDAGLSDYTPPPVATFRDVRPNHWAYKYIEYLASRGIVHGYGNGTYRPLLVCSRDQMTVFITRAFALPVPS
jgi:hypothetical protein